MENQYVNEEINQQLSKTIRKIRKNSPGKEI